jgi:hypothetical protein
MRSDMRILIVEDEDSHMGDAIKTMWANRVSYTIERNYYHAMRALKDHERGLIEKLDGVLTDIFMPTNEFAPWNDPNLPCGLGVALEAERLGLPFVICTSGYHHGARYDWICTIGRRRRWPEIVDMEYGDDPYTTEAPKKDWQRALDELKRIIALKPR